MKETKSYPPRLPPSRKEAVERLSKLDGTGINQFTGHKARADFKAFDKIMKRRGGKPPRQGDEIC